MSPISSSSPVSARDSIALFKANASAPTVSDPDHDGDNDATEGPAQAARERTPAPSSQLVDKTA